ncbi:hypothetical protein [Treponema endosymbiont of Eucomonympha sp.]|uniref:hypothetical protein n=1 Tax=Treponema endosymbiont of Eucomonympha sp. TaxID=1580831 RepID=UPI001396BE78|nr:hypothetical protein [Treponema endosymbiont of Eucomonympha sp.]
MQSLPLPSSPPFMSGVCSSTFKSTLPSPTTLPRQAFLINTVAAYPYYCSMTPTCNRHCRLQGSASAPSVRLTLGVV